MNSPANTQGLTISKGSGFNDTINDHHHDKDTNDYPTTKNDLDIAMLQILDPHLRPIAPANHVTSQKIYNEHKELAQEYLKVQTEIAYLTKQRESLLQNMSQEERDKRLDICNKLKEKVINRFPIKTKSINCIF